MKHQITLSQDDLKFIISEFYEDMGKVIKCITFQEYQAQYNRYVDLKFNENESIAAVVQFDESPLRKPIKGE